MKCQVKKYVLSIIIPQYNETEEQMRSLFETLNSQIGVNFGDFEVVLVNDCSETVISSEFLSKFKNLNVKSFRTSQNGGSGMCRQFGIDHTKSEWIWFIDADDSVFSLLAVRSVFDRINSAPDSDLITSKFLREVYSKELDEMFYVESNKPTWLHGKIYKRTFLEKYGIRFVPELRVNEDSYFNGLVFNCSPKIAPIDEVIYIWRHNVNSLTRKNNSELFITGYLDFIKAKEMFLEKIKTIVPIEDYRNTVAHEICFFYFDSQKKEWDRYNAPELKAQIERKILLFFIKYQGELNFVSKKQFTEAYQKVRSDSFSQPNYMEKETIWQYYERLSKKYLKK